MCFRKRKTFSSKEDEKLDLLIYTRAQLRIMAQRIWDFKEKYPDDDIDAKNLYNKLLELSSIPEIILRKEFNFWF